MNEKKIFRDIIENSISPFSLQLGYTRYKNYFYYDNGEFIYSYDCYLEKMKKKEFHFYIIASVDSKTFNERINRTNTPLPKGYDNIYSKVIFQCENLNDTSKNVQKDIITILNKIEIKLDKIKKISNLVDTCVKENYLVHHEDLFKYLVITKDEKRLRYYLAFVRKRLNDIADRAYETYLNKIDDLKNAIESYE